MVTYSASHVAQLYSTLDMVALGHEYTRKSRSDHAAAHAGVGAMTESVGITSSPLYTEHMKSCMSSVCVVKLWS